MTAPTNATKRKHGPVRRTFRWCRRTVLLLLFCAVVAVLYVNQIGLPDFAKGPLLSQLRERGIDLEFSRMRLRFGRGVVVEHVNLSRHAEVSGEQFHAEELQLRLRWSALMELRAPEIVAFSLRDGSVLLPLTAGPGEPPFPFAIDHVQARVLFSGPEHWELESLDATSHVGAFHAHGTLTNVSVLRSTRGRRTNTVAGDTWKRTLARTARELDRTWFAEPPDLDVGFLVDLRNPGLSAGDLRLSAKSASNAWARLDGIVLHVEVPRPTGTNVPQRADVSLAARRVVTPWADVSTLALNAHVSQRVAGTMPDLVEWGVECHDVETAWTGAAAATVSGRTEQVPLPAGESAPWTLPDAADWARMADATNGYATSLRIELDQPALHLTNAAASVRSLAVDLDATHDLRGWRGLRVGLDVADATSRWGSVESGRIVATLSPKARTNAPDPSLGPWDRWQALRAGSRLALTNLVVPKLDLARVAGDFNWDAPALSFTNLDIRLGDGAAGGEGRLDIVDRRVSVKAIAALDAHRAEPFLTTNAARWLRQFEWPQNAAPRLEGEVGVRLPAWTNSQPDWRGEVLSSLTLAATVAATNAGFRGLFADTAHGTVALTNRVWTVRDMDIHRPDGTVNFDYDGSDLTHDYHFRLRAVLSPLIALPLLDAELRGKLAGQVALGPPPLIEGDIWGRWMERERTGLALHVVGTNFVVRGTPIEWVDGHVAYTNLFMAFRDVHARSQGEAHVEGAAFDVKTSALSFTNAFSSVPPTNVIHIIGPKVSKILAPYQFAVPPKVRLEGVVGIHDPGPTDLRFDVVADDFVWWRLHGTNLTAKLRLLPDSISIDRLHGAFNRGEVAGNLFFDWRNEQDVRFRLDIGGTNLDLANLLQTTGLSTNRMEGRLTGRVTITQASVVDRSLYAGRGALRVEDGYLWGLPVFGLFSPIFDAVSPGLGQTRFTEASASFFATNGVLLTRDMQMRSPTMRLQYRGTVDTSSRLDATMEAELFRDTPLIGRLLQFAFMPVTKLLEYRVRGTVTKPEAEPRYVPKFLMSILRPIQTLKSLLPSDDKPAPAPQPTPPDKP